MSFLTHPPIKIIVMLFRYFCGPKHQFDKVYFFNSVVFGQIDFVPSNQNTYMTFMCLIRKDSNL